MSNRDAYIEKITRQLNELNAAMDKLLEVKAQQAKKEVRYIYKVEMYKLRQQSELAIDKLNALKTASEESWKNLVANTEKLRESFIHSFHYFTSQQ